MFAATNRKTMTITEQSNDISTAEIILSQTSDLSVIDFCKKVDSSINYPLINRELRVCLTWENKLAVDFDCNFECIKNAYEQYL